MPRLLVICALVLLTACSGSSSDDDASSGAPVTVDPCTLVSDAEVEAVLGTVPAPTSKDDGTYRACTWADEAGGSVVVGVGDCCIAKPEPCPVCEDVTLADGGYVSIGEAQSTVEVNDGEFYLSITTTDVTVNAQGLEALAASALDGM